MSHASPALSLAGRDDEAFESQIRHDAHARLRLAHEHSPRGHREHKASPRATGARWARQKAHAQRWHRAAIAAALLAFGAGLLWPVASPDTLAGLDVPAHPRAVRVLQGEQLASLDQSGERAQ